MGSWAWPAKWDKKQQQHKIGQLEYIGVGRRVRGRPWFLFFCEGNSASHRTEMEFVPLYLDSLYILLRCILRRYSALLCFLPPILIKIPLPLSGLYRWFSSIFHLLISLDSYHDLSGSFYLFLNVPITFYHP
ncbi:hypothetical protein CDAR_520461 [Caerostris darwini]|uniref:Uncharacterized protein n=1 Tax=Caerostris darwini TaxID=1538125 RepID=A0AAV4W7F0_9ARAC|nr:hypothetical protein CDAR_520461 [Caerostris darwini]